MHLIWSYEILVSVFHLAPKRHLYRTLTFLFSQSSELLHILYNYLLTTVGVIISRLLTVEDGLL